MSDPSHFADRLVARVRELGHPLCVGLDPHLTHLPPLFHHGAPPRPSDPATSEVVGGFLAAVVDRIADRAVAVKPQIALFETMGWRGLRVLQSIVGQCRRLGLPVILDAKRGDIGSSAEGYATAYLDPESPTPVDALTVNPYLGLDSLEPFLLRAARGAGVFVLVRTSNPGGSDFQDLRVAAAEDDGSDDDAGPVHLRVAAALGRAAAERCGPETGWSSVGAVVGATRPGEAEAVRERLPDSLFLVPGYGAQGASAEDATRGFVPGPAGLEGGVVSSSRGILFPPGSDTDDAGAWEAAIDEAVDRAVGELGEAVSG